MSGRAEPARQRSDVADQRITQLTGNPLIASRPDATELVAPLFFGGAATATPNVLRVP